MKKILTLATAAFLFTGVAFADGDDKKCGKDDKCCKKGEKKEAKCCKDKAKKKDAKTVKA